MTRTLSLFIILLALFPTVASAAPIVTLTRSGDCTKWNLLQAGFSCAGATPNGIITAASAASGLGAFFDRVGSGGTTVLAINTTYNVQFDYTVTAGTFDVFVGDCGTAQIMNISGSGHFSGTALTCGTNTDRDLAWTVHTGTTLSGTFKNLCIDTDGSCTPSTASAVPLINWIEEWWFNH